MFSPKSTHQKKKKKHRNWARSFAILIFSDLPMFLQAVSAIDYYSPVIAHMKIMKVSRKSCKVL